MLPYIKLFTDTSSTVDLLTDEEAGRLFKAVLHYANKKEDELPGREALVFSMLKSQIDRDVTSYEEFCEKQRVNGLKGGRPKKPVVSNDNPNNPVVNSKNPKNPVVFDKKPEKPVVYLKTQKSQEEDKEEDKEEEDLLRIQSEHDELFEASINIGLPQNNQNIHDIVRLYEDYGLEAVRHGIQQAGKYNKISIAYIEKVAKDYGKGKQDDGDDLPDMSTVVF